MDKELPKAKFQIQINQIDNGFLIHKPGETITNPQTGQVLIIKEPSSVFVEDDDGACTYIRAIWPREASKIAKLV